MIVDVGGGIGSLLANILLKNNNSRGINYDLPELEIAAKKYFQEKNIAPRCQYIGGDFLKSIPTGGDIYLMKAILHGKNDEIAMEILTRCKDVLPRNGRLLVIERIIDKAGNKNYIEHVLMILIC
ncbi:MAG: hypothetical protein ACD_46C00732G0009 [uncultured bacterium]|nr:MAG: hypothetical protein ACD_46C00732G0009 [uncultured bacterium]